MTSMLVAVAALTLMNFLYKAAGPAILTDREFSSRTQVVIDAFSPALLTGLLVVELLGEEWNDFDPTMLPGLLAAAIAWRFQAPQLMCIAFGVVVTVLVRLAQ